MRINLQYLFFGYFQKNLLYVYMEKMLNGENVLKVCITHLIITHYRRWVGLIQKNISRYCPFKGAHCPIVRIFVPIFLPSRKKLIIPNLPLYFRLCNIRKCCAYVCTSQEHDQHAHETMHMLSISKDRVYA
jgi:hypothetical protein